MAGFSIIVPTYNRAELLRSALASIQSLLVPSGWDVEVLVIDNNSTDHTAAVVAECLHQWPLPVRCVRESAQGLNNARNRGLHESRFDHLVYLDDDIQIEPGWLQAYVQVHDKLSPDAVAGPVEPMFEAPPADWMTQRMIESVTSSYSQKGDRQTLIAPQYAHELPGCNFGVSRQVASALGGFHPGLDRCAGRMLAGGDFELGQRLVHAGKRVAYAPGCIVHHLISCQKLSPAGLRARWEGLGATERILMELRGDKLPATRQLHLGLRTVRLAGRSLRLRLAGDTRNAFRWELEARRLFNFLDRGRNNYQQYR